MNEGVKEVEGTTILSANLMENYKAEVTGTYEELESIWENILGAKVILSDIVLPMYHSFS